MSNVKIKKSVLQSIIRKSLSESGLHSDPSRRLVVGPDSSSLPSMLPLTPSDRMSTQLEVERPPVEDPEYAPMNSKELGLALQALAEMIPADNVAEAYRDFQSVIEKINDEAQKDDELDHMGGAPDFEDEDEDEDMSVDAQLESIRRKNKRFDALLREADVGSKRGSLRGQSKSSKSNENPEALAALARMKDYKPKADEDPSTRKEQMAAFGKWLVRKKITTPTTRQGFSDKFKEFLRDEKYQLPGRDDVAAMMRDRGNDEPGDRIGDLSDLEKYRPSNATSVFQILQRYPEVCDSYNIQRLQAGLLSDLVGGRSITKDELETFLKSINDSFLNDSAMKKEWRTAFKGGINDASILADFIRKFSDPSEASTSIGNKEDKFSWRGQFKNFGYAAESGLRQAFIKDVESLFKLKRIVFPDDNANEIEASASEAFETALTDPDNKEFLYALFDEEGIKEYIKAIENPEDYEASDLYLNFRGIIGYEVVSKIAELNFKPRNGKPGRVISKAFISPQLPAPPGSKEAETDGEPTPDERKQLESIAVDGTFKEFFDEFIEEHKADKYKNLLTGAAILTGEDLDVEEYGNYIEPAFVTLKQLTSGKKTPDVAVKRTVDTDSPEGQAYIAGLKTASKPKRK
jgi:hypothetical protein